MTTAVLVTSLVLAVYALLALVALRWVTRRPRAVARRSVIEAETRLAEARIDYLTREAMQRMRDVVRDDLRGHGTP